MGGYQRTLRSGSVLLVLATGACSFDTSVAFESTADNLFPDASASGIDAGITPNADASAFSEPDAAVAGPDGTLQSFSRNQDVEIDGAIDNSWSAATFLDFAIADAQLFEVYQQSYVPSASLRMASLYDDDNIYFFIEVTDDSVVVDSSQIYHDDSIEITIDGLNDRSGPYGNDDHWFLVTEGKYASDGPASIELDGAFVRTQAGYNIEFSVERSDLGAGGNTTLGFNIGLNDDDGAGNSNVDAYGAWFFPNTPNCNSCCAGKAVQYPWCDTTKLGQLELVP
tara:strand:- start:12460 stop:13305 length:846 start_codon:yes stop_codon:yes gene_type:complete